MCVQKCTYQEYWKRGARVQWKAEMRGELCGSRQEGGLSVSLLLGPGPHEVKYHFPTGVLKSPGLPPPVLTNILFLF